LPPEAVEVQSVLHGKRWHLNLLGVELRSVKVEKIVFRTTGATAAPVLAAVTIQR